MPLNCPALTGERGQFRSGWMTFKVKFLALWIQNFWGCSANSPGVAGLLLRLKMRYVQLSTQTGCLSCWILLYFHAFNETHGAKCHDSCAQVSAPTWCERLRSLPCAGTPSRSASLLNMCLRCLPLAFMKPKARTVIPNAVSKRGVTLQVKAFSCFWARVCGSARRVFTYANKEGSTIIPVQRTHAHLHTMPKESSSPAAEKLPLPGTVSYICNLIDRTGEATSWRAFLALRMGAWPHPCRVLPQPRVIPCTGISGVQRDAPPIWS